MILFELTGSEAHPVYQELQIANGNRHYDFLRSIVATSVGMGRPLLSQTAIKALNYHAIACLHVHAGEYRPCEVTVGTHTPPGFWQVPALMEDLVNRVNRFWEATDPVALATHVLWQINYIHPFINGNGRTARAASYLVLCLRHGGWLPGEVILPELLKRNRDEYIEAHRVADQSLQEGPPDLTVLHALVSRLLAEQLQSAGFGPNGGDAPTP